MRYMIADKIRLLREQASFTQSQLAKKLGITRSSVNAWEMGLSIPSTQYVVELANIFNVSTDYLLGMNENATLNISALNKEERSIVYNLVSYLSDKKSS